MGRVEEILNHTTPGQVISGPELAEQLIKKYPQTDAHVYSSKITRAIRTLSKYGYFEVAGTDYTCTHRPIILWRRL